MFGEDSREVKAFVIDFLQRLNKAAGSVIEGGDPNAGLKVLGKIEDFARSFSFH
jgi:hypothetical protein